MGFQLWFVFVYHFDFVQLLFLQLNVNQILVDLSEVHLLDDVVAECQVVFNFSLFDATADRSFDKASNFNGGLLKYYNEEHYN